MTCTFCHSTSVVPTKRNALYCMHCGKTSPREIVADMSVGHVGVVSRPPIGTKYIARVLLGTALLLGLGTSGAFGYSQYTAQSLITKASKLDQRQKYSEAQSALTRAQKYYALPGTKKALATEQAKNKRWTADAAKQKLAAELTAKKDYAGAIAQLSQISADYPGAMSSKVALDAAKSAKLAADQAAAAASAKAAEDAAAAKAKAKSQAPSKTAPILKEIVKIPPKAQAPTTVGSTSGIRFGSTTASAALGSASSLVEAQTALQSFGDQYHLSIHTGPTTAGSAITYWYRWQQLSEPDLAIVKAYGSLFIDEWSKYPLSFVASSNITDIYLMKNLTLSGKGSGAYNDVGIHALGFDVTYATPYYSAYARHAIHHEYTHLFEYAFYGTFFRVDEPWNSLNPPNFSYGSGGYNSAYGGTTFDIYALHPLPGFVTGYAETGAEEDRADLFSYLMVAADYRLLKQWTATDTNLAGKVNIYKTMVATHAPEMAGDYYDRINP